MSQENKPVGNIKDASTTREEAVAKLRFMVDHNIKHADIYDALVLDLERFGMEQARQRVLEAIETFDLANRKLAEALNYVE